MVADGCHHGKRQHDQADVAMPAAPRAALVVVEAKLILGDIKAALDAPALPFKFIQAAVPLGTVLVGSLDQQRRAQARCGSPALPT